MLDCYAYGARGLLYLEEGCEEEGQVLDKGLLFIGPMFISNWYVSAGGQDHLQLLDEHFIQLFKLLIELCADIEAGNLQYAFLNRPLS